MKVRKPKEGNWFFVASPDDNNRSALFFYLEKIVDEALLGRARIAGGKERDWTLTRDEYGHLTHVSRAQKVILKSGGVP